MLSQECRTGYRIAQGCSIMCAALPIGPLCALPTVPCHGAFCGSETFARSSRPCFMVPALTKDEELTM